MEERVTDISPRLREGYIVPDEMQPDSRDVAGLEDSMARNMREIVSTMLELFGIAALTAGFWLIAPWCGLIALGVCLILMGIATSGMWDSGDQ